MIYQKKSDSVAYFYMLACLWITYQNKYTLIDKKLTLNYVKKDKKKFKKKPKEKQIMTLNK